MMKLVALFSLFAAVSAFAPAPVTKPSTALKMDPKAQLGVLPPLGACPPDSTLRSSLAHPPPLLGFWDPLGLIKNGPYGSPEDNFAHYRAVEVKHGRIAMAGFLGLITAENFRFEVRRE
jgi:hypothetical protein